MSGTVPETAHMATDALIAALLILAVYLGITTENQRARRLAASAAAAQADAANADADADAPTVDAAPGLTAELEPLCACPPCEDKNGN